MVGIDISVNHIFHVAAPNIKPLTEVFYDWKKAFLAATLLQLCKELFKHKCTWKNSIIKLLTKQLQVSTGSIKNDAQSSLRKKNVFLNNSSFLQLIFPDSKLMAVTNDT